MLLPPRQQRGGLLEFGSPHGTVEEFHAAVDSFTSLDAEGQEREVLRSASESWLSRTYLEWPPNPDPPDIAELRAKLMTADARDIVSAWLEWARETPRRQDASQCMSVLMSGGPITLAMVSDTTGTSTGLRWELADITAERVRRRIDRTTFEAMSDETLPDTGTVDASTLAKPFTERGIPYEYRKVFQTSTARDPQRVADLLMTWPPEEHRSVADQWSYAMGSYFAWKCGGDRARHLKRLLGAKDPTIRVAAAVYLRFEDRPAGMRALREFKSLPGAPGAWAALTLAREGDGDALPRAFDVLEGCPDARSSNLERQLQQQLLVLLSNALRVNPGVPAGAYYYFPHQWGAIYWDCQGSNLPLHHAITGWWGGHGDTRSLRDPWLDELTALKVD
jgi:hypothetical protein